MAVHTAVDGTVTSGGTAIAQLRSIAFSTDAEMIDTTTISSTSKTFAAGTLSSSGEVTCFWDETDTGQLTLIEGSTVSLVFAFEGATSGDYTYSVSGLVNSVSISSSVDGMVEATFGFQGSGAVTRGTV